MFVKLHFFEGTHRFELPVSKTTYERRIVRIVFLNGFMNTYFEALWWSSFGRQKKKILDKNRSLDCERKMDSLPIWMTPKY